MLNQIDHIVGHLFHQKKLDEVSEAELEEFIANYPYFAAGHFLLAKKTQRNSPRGRNKRVATTGLYYPNALWLQWLLDHDLSSDGKKLDIKYPVANDSKEDVSLVLTSEAAIPADLQVDVVEKNEEVTNVDELSEQGKHTTPVNEFALASETITNNSSSEQEGEVTVAAYEPQEIDNTTEEQLTQLDSGNNTESGSSGQGIAAVEEQPVNEEKHTSSDTSLSVQHTEPANDSTVVHGSDIAQDISPQGNKDKEQLFAGLNDETSENRRSDSEEAEIRASAASIERTLNTATLIPTKAELEKNEFTFEPYHTIDYFASQGIRLQQSDLSKDKFGKQLKSFTEWLRSMKRLPQAAVEANMDEATQQTIQKIAEHSFEEKEIVTETMAEVWIKQGNKEKAIDTLHKLSLLNPSKSHYFAAKIEQLKA